MITLSTNILFANMEYIKLLYLQSNNLILLLYSMQKNEKLKMCNNNINKNKDV